MDAHAREAAGALAGMAEIYGERWIPRVGDLVRGELPFLGTYGAGVIVDVNAAFVTVRIGNEHLAYYPEELAFLGPKTPGVHA
jgi:hypothetical protein